MFGIFNNGPMSGRMDAMAQSHPIMQNAFNNMQSRIGDLSGLFAQHPGMFNGGGQMQPLTAPQHVQPSSLMPQMPYRAPKDFMSYAAGSQPMQTNNLFNVKPVLGGY